MIDTEKLSALLKWAAENLDTLEEIKATGETAQIQLKDGRRGLLYMDAKGLPCVALPATV